MVLSKLEMMMIIDATNGLSIPDGSPLKGPIVQDVVIGIDEGLAEKWSVSPNNLIEKMEIASEDEYKELWERIGNFWAKRDKDGAPDDNE